MVGQQAVYNYLIAIVEVYQEGSKKKRGELLDHAELITKRSRKHLIKKLNQAKRKWWGLPSKAFWTTFLLFKRGTTSSHQIPMGANGENLT